jgi:alpha-1,2-mannosyltransferase
LAHYGGPRLENGSSEGVLTGAQPRRISLIALSVALAAAFSLAVGWYQLFGLRELHEYLEYDDGVWFGTSVRLAHGIFPYRNFVDDQPPGVPVAMLPFALLSRSVGTATAFAAARVAVPLFETVGVLALGWMLRHRGALTVAVACGAMAVYPVCLIDQRTVMLEPFCATFCLLGLAAVFDGDRLHGRTGPLVVGGAFFGLAGSCKAFALLPFVVVAAALLASPARRRLVPFLAGTAGAFVVVCGPFFVLAPGAFVHDVIVTQLSRTGTVDPSIYDRLTSLVGSPPSQVPTPLPDASQRTLAVVLAVVIVVLVVGGYAAGRLQDHRYPTTVLGWFTRLDAVAIATVVVTGAGLATPAAYYYHYAAFFGPFLALMVGLAAGRTAMLAPKTAAALTAALLLAGAVHAIHVVRASRGGLPDVALVQRFVPAGACVLGDDAPTLLLADRFSSTVPGCTAVTDAFGTTLSSDGGYPATSPEAESSATVKTWLVALEHADYVVLALGYQERRIPWNSPVLQGYLQEHFRTVRSSGYVILRRDVLFH